MCVSGSGGGSGGGRGGSPTLWFVNVREQDTEDMRARRFVYVPHAHCGAMPRPHATLLNGRGPSFGSEPNRPTSAKVGGFARRHRFPRMLLQGGVRTHGHETRGDYNLSATASGNATQFARENIGILSAHTQMFVYAHNADT